MRAAFRTTLSLAVAMWLGAFPMGAAADSSNDWITVADRGPFILQSASTVVLNGTRTADGSCHSALTLTHAPGDAPTAGFVSAFNPRTCQEVLVMGTPIDVPTPHTSGYSSALATAVQAGPTVQTPMATDQRYGYAYVGYADPAQLIVNEVEDEITWTYDGTNVISVDAASDHRQWFSPDGWTESGHQGPYLTKYTTYATLITRDTFQNHPWNQTFCGGTGGDTTARYSTAGLIAFGSGSLTNTIDTSVYGCDSYLLSRFYYFM